SPISRSRSTAAVSSKPPETACSSNLPASSTQYAARSRCSALDPRDPFSAIRLLHIACGLYFSREYEAAIEAAKRLIRSYPDVPMIYRWPAAALGQLDRPAEAREWLEQAISL